MKKLLLFLLFTSISFAQNQTWTGIKTIAPTFKMVGIQPAVGGEKAVVLDATGKPKLAVFSPNVAQVNSDWLAFTGFAQILNKPKIDTRFENVIIGENSMPNTGLNGSNVAIGEFSMQNNSSGLENTAIGFNSLRNNKTGNSNIAIGVNSNLSVNNSGNITIGNNGSLNNVGFNSSNNILLGNESIVNGNGNTIIGVSKVIDSNDCVYIGANTISKFEINENGVIRFVNSPPIFADNAAALSGGLTGGQIYQTADFTLKIVN